MHLLIIGCGAVAQCTIPLIFKNTCILPKNVSVFDPALQPASMQEFINAGMTYHPKAITHENFVEILKKHLKPGDICIDLANKVDTIDILSWCHKNNVRYLNTCLNKWKQEKIVPIRELYEAVLQLSSEWDHIGPTSVLSHGANPGLVSSFTKQALIDMARHTLKNNKDFSAIENLENALDQNNFPQLASLQNIQVIHISEMDTQKLSYEKKPNQFLNTWSIIEFADECRSKAEFAWGTHETEIPPKSDLIKNDLFMQIKAMDLHIRSWLPTTSFVGIVPPHDEVLMIADYLSIKNNHTYTYRPTILFVYLPSHFAQESLKEFKEKNFKFQDEQKVVHEGIITGADTMGALLLTPDGGWWTGSSLTIQATQELLPGNNATVMQVAAGALAALVYVLDNPKNGIYFPETLDHEKILKVAKPYLGDFISVPCAWKPTKDKNALTFKNFIAD